METLEVSVQLEDILHLVTTHTVTEDKETFNYSKGMLSAELATLLQEAVDMKWPFVEEKWQYKHSVESEDKVNTTELINKHLQELMKFLRASIKAGQPAWAMAVIFLLDRFLYWLDRSHTLLKIAKTLHRLYPRTPVAPQIVIRQARVYLNNGKLQRAEFILSSLINNSGATGCWRYFRDSDQTLVQAVSVQIRGQVLQKLGLWLEAAELIWASLIGFYVLPLPDKKGIGTSLGLLANILISMNDEDFDTFKRKPHINLEFLGDCRHRLLCAAQAAKLAAVYSQYGSLYVLTHMVTQGTCLLSYSFSRDCPAAETQIYLSLAKEAFENGLLTKKTEEVVTSQQELHTVLRAAYGLATTNKWLNGPSKDVRAAVRSCRDALSLFYSYCFQEDGDKNMLSSEVTAKIQHVKSLFSLKPFANSDPSSFIPDAYRVIEDKPVPFTIADFTKVMHGFQRHHKLVCEAFSALKHKGGADATHADCITAFQTRTQSLLTENQTGSGILNSGQPEDKGLRRSSASSDPLSELHNMQKVDGALKSNSQSSRRISWQSQRTSYSQSSRSSSLSSSWGSMSFKSGSSLGMVNPLCCTEDDEGPLHRGDTSGCTAADSVNPNNMRGSDISFQRSSSQNSGEVNESSTSKRPEMRTSTRSVSSSLGSSWQSISFSRSPLNGRLSVDQACETEDPGSPYEYVDLQSSASPSLIRGLSQTGSDLSERENEQAQVETQSDIQSADNPELLPLNLNEETACKPGLKDANMEVSCLSTEFELLHFDKETSGNMNNSNVTNPHAKGEEPKHTPPEMPEDMGADQHSSGSATSLHSCTSCFQGCIMESAVLKEMDYKCLLSGVCQECLLKRLPKKDYQLSQYKRAYNALVLKYSKSSDSWTASETSVFVGDVLDVAVKGQQRQAFRVQYLHQELLLGSYVGKEYLKKRKIHKHLDDVERQMTAQFYVREFNRRLYENNITTQIFYIPAEILLLLEGDSIVACVSVEPYMLGEFVKLSNNTTKINPHHSATEYGLAFGHFTYEFSNKDEVVVDLQGWVTANGKGLVYLTDPQIHSCRKPKSTSNFHQRGIDKFLQQQHGEKCNSICRAAELQSLAPQ